MTDTPTDALIRPARPSDVPAVLAIWNPVIRHTLVTFSTEEKTAASLQALIDERVAGGFCFLVAQWAGQVAGFATYAQFRCGNGYARTLEHTVILAPEASGNGLGRALMAAVEDHAAAGGGHTIYAGVSADNPEGIAFHAAVGYRELAVLPEAGWKFGRWIDLVLMQKKLGEAAGSSG